MENTLNKIFQDEKTTILNTNFKGIEIIIVYINKTFEGIYAINIENFDELSKFHFYTTEFPFSKNIRAMCIKTIDIFKDHEENKSYLSFDFFNDINEDIKKWWNNNYRIKKFNIDVLGMRHGGNIYENIGNFLNNNESISYDSVKKDEYEESIYSANALAGALKSFLFFWKRETYEIFKKVKPISIEKLFEEEA